MERSRFPKLPGRLRPKWAKTLLRSAFGLRGVEQTRLQPVGLIARFVVARWLQGLKCKLCALLLCPSRQTEKALSLGLRVPVQSVPILFRASLLVPKSRNSLWYPLGALINSKLFGTVPLLGRRLQVRRKEWLVRSLLLFF